MSLILLENLSLGTGVLGLFLAMPLIALARQRPASMWLALYVLTISAASLEDYAHYQHLPWIAGMAWPNLAVDVLYYCYVRSMTGLGNGRFQTIHFVPLACYLSAALVALLPGSPFAPWFADWEHGAGAAMFYQCQGAFYLGAVLLRLRQHRQRLRAGDTTAGTDALRWLTTLSCVLAALWISWVLAVRLHGNWTACFVAGRLATFYFVGWYGLRRATVFLPATAAPPVERCAPVAPPAGRTAAAAPAPAPTLVAVAAPVPANPATADLAAGATAEREKYARSGMTDATQRLIGERLQRRMSLHRDFLESDLRLTELAERIGTTPQLLSQYLNHMLGLSFFDYVNGLRIAEVQNMMRDPAGAGRTLLELAHAAGFNSKSTFNTAFKNVSGMAPSQWRARHAGEPAPVPHTPPSPSALPAHGAAPEHREPRQAAA
ncbi:helix-turn-helix transcriptional regulator [Duganella sp. FT3S]|uniref:Helix-turn-helix transcriptional regulator n=1 Tax=Rugamonas fusca TaxID=2758568 RepID=A0A7W2I8R2_9BURK|nr:AraC family transcriptional regulator [Rugamonas fusca]MBA5607819.1 helix-turn-helix transcriptional regulator [Rugamonas fusca]